MVISFVVCCDEPLVVVLIQAQDSLSEEIRMVFNETILGALIIGVLVGGAILYSDSKSSSKRLIVEEGIGLERLVNEARTKEKPRRLVIRKEMNVAADHSEEQPNRQSSTNATEVRVELRLDESNLNPSEIAEKIEEALQNSLNQLPFDVEVNINAVRS